MLWTWLFSVVAISSLALAIPVEPILKRTPSASVIRTFESCTGDLNDLQTQMAPYDKPGSTVGPQVVSLISKVTLSMARINDALKPAATNGTAMLLDSDEITVLPTDLLKVSCVDFFEAMVGCMSPLLDMRSIALVKEELTDFGKQLKIMDHSFHAVNTANSAGLLGLLGGGGEGPGGLLNLGALLGGLGQTVNGLTSGLGLGGILCGGPVDHALT